MWKQQPLLRRPLANNLPAGEPGGAGGARILPAPTPVIMLRAAILPALAMLCACQDDNQPGPGGVTVGEARALDDAAQMLDQQRLPPDPAPEPGTQSDAED